MISYNEKRCYKNDDSCCVLCTLNPATAHITIVQLQVVSIATTRNSDVPTNWTLSGYPEHRSALNLLIN